MNNNTIENRNNNSKYVVHYNFRNLNNGQLYNYNRKEIRPDFIDVVNMRKLTVNQRDNYLKELAYYIKCSVLRAGTKPKNAFIQNVISEVLKPTNILNLGNNVINKENIQQNTNMQPNQKNINMRPKPANSNSKMTRRNVLGGPYDEYNSNTENNGNSGGKPNTPRRNNSSRIGRTPTRNNGRPRHRSRSR